MHTTECTCPMRYPSFTVGRFRERYGVLRSHDSVARDFDAGKLHGYTCGATTYREIYSCPHNLAYYHVNRGNGEGEKAGG